MAKILIPPARVPVVDGAGNATVPWYTFFAQHLQAQADLPAGQITVGQVAEWNLAHGWGNHALAGYLSEEADPVFAASDAAAIGSADISDWHAAYSWGNHAAAGYLVADAAAPSADATASIVTVASPAVPAQGGAYVQADVQAIATLANELKTDLTQLVGEFNDAVISLNDLKAKLRAAGLLAP